MKTKVFLSVILLPILFGCMLSMSPGGEIVDSSYAVVKQDGKSIWLIYRDSTGNDYEEANGIHKIKYTTYQRFKKTKVFTEYYNLYSNYLDTNSVLEYAKAVEIHKGKKLTEQSFYDSSNHLIQPSYFNFAKMKQKHFNDGSWKVSYYDLNNKPSCNFGATERRVMWDTIWMPNELDTSYMLGTKTLNYKKCTQ